jgi:hypothetical protein
VAEYLGHREEDPEGAWTVHLVPPSDERSTPLSDEWDQEGFLHESFVERARLSQRRSQETPEPPTSATPPPES